MKKGKFIVIEGNDGSGKTTQQQLLKKYLENENRPVQSIKFPQYEDNFFGKTIASYLRGDLGPLTQVNPFLISIVYAMDRAMAKEKMNKWLENGDLLVFDRYVSSNLAHQCGRLPKRQRNKYLDWDIELEYTVNKLPKEDIVIYLYVPYKVLRKLLRNHDRGTGGNYTKKSKRDIVERDEAYLKNSEETYLWLTKKFSHWIKINCVDKKGSMRSREEIHEEIKTILRRKKLL